MKEIDQIAALLRDESIEKQMAAAIVLAALKIKTPSVTDGLCHALTSNVQLVQKHAADAIAAIGGAKKALPLLFPMLLIRDEELKRAAVRAIQSMGDEIVPIVRERMQTATPEERRALDSLLADLGGKEAFSALLESLISADGEAAKAAALAVRHEVKDADARTRRSYFTQVEKFLKAKKTQEVPAALVAGIKILGYLEDPSAMPTLLAYATNEKLGYAIRQEALIAMRFALGKAGTDETEVVDALLRAAEAPDRLLAQTAFHTLGALQLPPKLAAKLVSLAKHPDYDRARFAIDQLGRQGTPESVQALVSIVTGPDRRRADFAAAHLHGKDEAIPLLAKALLNIDDRERAWTIRTTLRPGAKKISAALKKQFVERAAELLATEAAGWEAVLDIARECSPEATSEALHALVDKYRRGKKGEKAKAVLSVICKSESATDTDRYALASLELADSPLDTTPGARERDEALRVLRLLVKRGFDVATSMRKDRSLDLPHLYYVGFHFIEEDQPLGDELLLEVVKKGGRTKLAKMAKNKLQLATKHN